MSVLSTSVLGCSRAPEPEVFTQLLAECQYTYYQGESSKIEIVRIDAPIPAARVLDLRTQELNITRVDVQSEWIDSSDFRVMAKDLGELGLMLEELVAKSPEQEESPPRILLIIDPSRPAAEVATIMALARAKSGDGFATPVVSVRTPAPAKSIDFEDPALAKQWFDYMDHSFSADAEEDSEPERPSAGRGCDAIEDVYGAVANAPVGKRCETEIKGLAAAAQSCPWVDWDARITLVKARQRGSFEPELETWVLAEGDPAAFGEPGATWGDVAQAWATRP